MGKSDYLAAAFVLLNLACGLASAQSVQSSNSKSSENRPEAASSALTGGQANIPPATQITSSKPSADGSSIDQQSDAKPKRKGTGPGSPEAVLPLFAISSYRYTGGGYHDKLIRYCLFIPDNTNPPKKLPLIVWLHGHGEAGQDNVRHLMHLGACVFIKPSLGRKRFPFFFLAVQCPADNPDWTTTSESAADDMVNVVLAILDKTVKVFPVDSTRISLAGVSGGGTGCWELAMRAPGRFSAVAPLGSGGGDLSRADQLIGLPVWAFHSTGDRIVKIDGDRKTVAAIRSLGGRAFLTEIESSGHDCWTSAFLDYDLLDWLLYQRRGQVSDYPPGTLTLKNRWHRFTSGLAEFAAGWNLWQAILQISIPLVLIFMFWSAKRRRRLRLAKAVTAFRPSWAARERE